VLLLLFIHKFDDRERGLDHGRRDTQDQGGVHGGSLSLQPAHGGIGSISPDHEVIDGTWNRGEDGPQNAEDNYPACSASRLLVIRRLPIRTWFVHGPAPPHDLDKGLSLRMDPLTLNLDLACGEKKRRRCDDFAVRSPLNLVGFWLLQDRNLSEKQGTWEV
jgi:hypothetical protein